VVALAVVLMSGAAACDSGDDGRTETIRVLAAASLTDAFGEMSESFETDHSSVDIELTFGSSSDLALQIEQGAPADVFASADEVTMQGLVDKGLIRGSPAVFALNSLAVVVAPGNPFGIDALSDLASEDLVVALGAEDVPVGRYAREALASAGVDVHPDTLETDAKAIVTRIAVGEADAGIVYTTDVNAAGDDVSGVPIPVAHNVVARYPIGLIGEADAAAAEFVDLVTSAEGRAILETHGFGVP
jgi:molybdate transport system substrate-binding protein